MSQNKILITGINGFVGVHLANELSARGHLIIGVGVSEAQADTTISDKIEKYIQCDIADQSQVSNLELHDISAVINLAGLANVGASFSNPDLYMDVNVRVLSVLGKELFDQNPKARMIAVSTGALYNPHQKMPLNESSELSEKSSPYAESKRAMEIVAQDFADAGYDCVVVRPFNHIGPGQGLGFLVPDMIEKIRHVDQADPKITAGNLDTIRDYTDVRDIVNAYADLATAPKLRKQLYNVCSGNGKSGNDILKSICTILNVSYDSLTIDVDQSLIRPNDAPKIIGDSSLLQNETGWRPTIPLDQTIEDIFLLTS